MVPGRIETNQGGESGTRCATLSQSVQPPPSTWVAPMSLLARSIDCSGPTRKTNEPTILLKIKAKAHGVEMNISGPFDNHNLRKAKEITSFVFLWYQIKGEGETKIKPSTSKGRGVPLVWCFQLWCGRDCFS